MNCEVLPDGSRHYLWPVCPLSAVTFPRGWAASSQHTVLRCLRRQTSAHLRVLFLDRGSSLALCPRNSSGLHLPGLSSSARGVSQYLPWDPLSASWPGNPLHAGNRHTCRAFFICSHSSEITDLCYLIFIVFKAVVVNILPDFVLGESVNLVFIFSSWLETKAPQSFLFFNFFID